VARWFGKRIRLALSERLVATSDTGLRAALTLGAIVIDAPERLHRHTFLSSLSGSFGFAGDPEDTEQIPAIKMLLLLHRIKQGKWWRT
jgi:hypothetical protein